MKINELVCPSCSRVGRPARATSNGDLQCACGHVWMPDGWSSIGVVLPDRSYIGTAHGMIQKIAVLVGATTYVVEEVVWVIGVGAAVASFVESAKGVDDRRISPKKIDQVVDAVVSGSSAKRRLIHL